MTEEQKAAEVADRERRLEENHGMMPEEHEPKEKTPPPGRGEKGYDPNLQAKPKPWPMGRVLAVAAVLAGLILGLANCQGWNYQDTPPVGDTQQTIDCELRGMC